MRWRLDHDKDKEVNSYEQHKDQLARGFDGNIETGFQIAVSHGPLCAEPMEGMAFFVEQVKVDRVGIEKEVGELFRRKGMIN